jgi:hypothetical protein
MNGSLRILQYHGSGRYKYTAQQLAKDYDGKHEVVSGVGYLWLFLQLLNLLKTLWCVQLLWYACAARNASNHTP